MFKKGFTLIELLVYIAIFAVVAGMLSGILATFVRIQGQETASASVTQELSFVQSSIQRLVRESVNIENSVGVASSTLTLRMASSTLDPTIISSDGNFIYLKQGVPDPQPLTSDRVKVSQFEVVKYENPGGHAVVQVDLSLTYNSQRLYQQITRNLKTSIGRVTAATFDDNLLPNQDNQFYIGISPNNRWKTLSLSNLLYLGNLAEEPTGSNGAIYYNASSSVFRGYKAGAWQNLGEGFWAASSTNIYNTNSGNVGVGTTGPSYKLDVSGTFRATSTSTFSGNVGIGMTNPAEKLEVNGAIKVGNTSGTNAGTIRWNGTAFEGYNGTSWIPLSGGGWVHSGEVVWQSSQTTNQNWQTINLANIVGGKYTFVALRVSQDSYIGDIYYTFRPYGDSTEYYSYPSGESPLGVTLMHLNWNVYSAPVAGIVVVETDSTGKIEFKTSATARTGTTVTLLGYISE